MTRLCGMILVLLLGWPGSRVLAQSASAVAAPVLEQAVELPEPGSAAELAAAEQAVTAFHAALLAALKSDGAFTERLAIIDPEVQSRFNLGTIARLSLGANWRNLTTAEREQFGGLLGDLIAATYADRFAKDSGQRFELVTVKPGRRGPMVRTSLHRASGSAVRLDYHFRDGKIYNVVADGVSDLSLRRADYNSIVKQQGFAALLTHLLEQSQSLSGTQTADGGHLE